MEIERRPHWSDDLIDAVIRAESDAHDYEYRAMAAIAAVEDWQERKGEENLPLLMAMMNAESTGFLRRAEKAEAQVQRVREMHTIDQCPRCAEFHCLECGCEGVYTEQVSCRTTRVLDGDSDE